MKKIAVLLTVFNRKASTLKCLDNLKKNIMPEGCEMDIYLTDDGCTDGTPEAVRTQLPNVIIINGNGSLYWNRGMYTAWEAASKSYDYDYYLWLNDDTYMYNHAVKSLVEASESKQDMAIIVGATVDTSTKSKVTYGGRINGKCIAPLHGEMTAVDYFNGNIVLIPAYAFKLLGNLDYYFTHSKGDFDYGLRAGKAGVSMYQCGKALGECDMHESIAKWCDPEVPFKSRWAMLNRPNGMPPKETFHFEKRHIGLGTAIFHYITILTRCLVPNVWIWFGMAKAKFKK